MSLDFSQIVSHNKPQMIVPHIKIIGKARNDQKPLVIARLLIRELYNSVPEHYMKSITHDGKLHQVRHFSIKPLLSGSWSIISLMLLTLPYSEQEVIIDGLYPNKAKLSAKAFALTFSQNTKQVLSGAQGCDDTVVQQKLDTAIAGIATILSIYQESGPLPHPDKASVAYHDMVDLAASVNDRNQYMGQMTRVDDLNR